MSKINTTSPKSSDRTAARQRYSAPSLSGRSCFGSVGLPGTLVLAVNEDASAVSQPVRLNSGATVLVAADGAWIYTSPQLSTRAAIDQFSCRIKTDGEVFRESVNVSLRRLEPSTTALLEATSRGDEEQQRCGYTALVTIATKQETKVSLPAVCEASPTRSVVVLEPPRDMNVESVDDCVIAIHPHNFEGTENVSLLLELEDGTTARVTLIVDVQSPVTFSSTRTRISAG